MAETIVAEAKLERWAVTQDLNKKLLVSNDVYNRTTEEKHKQCCRTLFERAQAAGDIYLSSYEGWCGHRAAASAAHSRRRMGCCRPEASQWASQLALRWARVVPATSARGGAAGRRYNVREETFVTEKDAAASEYKDPVSGKPLEKMKEESYFFRQSRCAAQPPALPAAFRVLAQDRVALVGCVAEDSLCYPLSFSARLGRSAGTSSV